MKKIVIIIDLGWSVHRVFQDIEAYLKEEYTCTYYNAKAFYLDKFIMDVTNADICFTTLNLYGDMFHFIKASANLTKFVFICHGYTEINKTITYSSLPTYSVTSDVLLPFAPSNTYLTPNGVNPTYFRKKECTGAIQNLGYCGSLWNVKRIDWSYKIAQKVHLPISLAISIPFEQMNAWYHSIDLLLVTSGPEPYVETGPLPPFEAICAGIPVIGTAVGNFRHVPGPKFSSMEEAVKIIEDLKKNPEIVKQLAKEQYEYIMTHFTYNVLVDSWKQMINNVIYKNKTSCTFINDNYTVIQLIDHPFTNIFKYRDNHEVLFRRLHSYLIKNKYIKGNIIDLGAWIGDNSIPWAKQIDEIIYAIDPSPENCKFIDDMCKVNKLSKIQIIQSAISDKNEILSTNENLNHCSFVYGNPGTEGKLKLNAVSLDYLHEQKEITQIGYIHLDVEGMEFRILQGSSHIIDLYQPIITYEQHLELDNIELIRSYLKEKKYTIFLIDEVLLGCRLDCRNFIAFPTTFYKESFVEEIHTFLNKKILLLQ